MACQEAVDRFMTIIGNIGGPQELARARDLVARLAVVPGSDFLKVSFLSHPALQWLITVYKNGKKSLNLLLRTL